MKVSAKKLFGFFLTFLIVILIFLALAYQFIQPNQIKFTHKAIWQPSKIILNELINCHKEQNGYLNCVEKLMKKNGASDQAIQFTKQLNSFGFMKSINTYGHNIAYAQTLEIAADYSSGYYLVNGTPNIIDINDFKFIGSEIWPSDHKMPVVKTLINGDQSFQFTYPIKTCHACKVTGQQTRTFLFNKYGKLLRVIKQ